MSLNPQELIDGFLDGSLSAEAFEQLDQWIKSDARHARKFASDLMLHDRLRGQLMMAKEEMDEEPVEPNLVASTRQMDLVWSICSPIAWLTTACLLLLGLTFAWQSLGTSTAAAAVIELNRIIAANDRSLDRTFLISVEETSIPTSNLEKQSPERARPPKPSLDGATLDVRGANRFVLTRKMEHDEVFVTGSNGVTSWAVRPDGPVRTSNDLTRFNRDVPGHENSLPINNLHDGLDALRTAYQLNVSTLEPHEIDTAAISRMTAAKRSGYLGPDKVEIDYVIASGQIRQIRYVDMPYGPERVTLTMTLIDERPLPIEYFDHQSHHDAHHIVESE